MKWAYGRFLEGAGLVSLDMENWNLHLAVYPRHWCWGKEDDRHFGWIYGSFGCGPLFLLCYDVEWWEGTSVDQYVYDE